MTLINDPSNGMDPSQVLAKLRKAFLWAGGAMMVLGSAALLLPFISSLFVEILIGWLLTVSGFVVVFGSFAFRRTGLFLWQLFAGLVTLAVGVLMLIFPLEGLFALTLLLAVVFLLTGAAQLAFTLWVRPAPGWGWAFGSAAVSIVLGGLILIALPEASALVLGLFVGIDLVSTGTALVLLARSVPQEFSN